ncbi:hypothetical protein V6N13_029711 [Hibiscus sabdariffa]
MEPQHRCTTCYPLMSQTTREEAKRPLKPEILERLWQHQKLNHTPVQTDNQTRYVQPHPHHSCTINKPLTGHPMEQLDHTKSITSTALQTIKKRYTLIRGIRKPQIPVISGLCPTKLSMLIDHPPKMPLAPHSAIWRG